LIEQEIEHGLFGWVHLGNILKNVNRNDVPCFMEGVYKIANIVHMTYIKILSMLKFIDNFIIKEPFFLKLWTMCELSMSHKFMKQL